MRIKRYILCIILVLIGIGLLFYPKVSNYLNQRNELDVIKQYTEIVETMSEEGVDIEYEKSKRYNDKLRAGIITYENIQEADNNINDSESDYYENILNIFGDGVMAYIEIPKISVNLPIYHGTDDEIMEKGVGHLEYSSLPIGEESSHSVLTGHTGLMKAEIFTRLNEMEVGDCFYINILGKKLTYKVFQTKVILPTELDDLQIVPNKDLVTLVTCTPYGVNTHRLLVQGERMLDDESEIEQNNSLKMENNIEKEQNNSMVNQTNENFYFVGVVYGIFILSILILGCILIKKIVKYISKSKKIGKD